MGGNQYRIGGVVGNDEGKTGIPKCRSAFRQEALLTELHDIYNVTVRPFDINKDTKGKAVEVQIDGKWVEVKIEEVPKNIRVQDGTFYGCEKKGIKIRYSTLWWCPRCAKSYKTDHINEEEPICSGSKKIPCSDKLVQTNNIRDEKMIRFRDRIVPDSNTPWKWESGDPVTWKDLAAKRSPKDSFSTRKRLPTPPRIEDTQPNKKNSQSRAEDSHLRRRNRRLRKIRKKRNQIKSRRTRRAPAGAKRTLE